MNQWSPENMKYHPTSEIRICHSCEDRNPVFLFFPGFPLPCLPQAGAGMTIFLLLDKESPNLGIIRFYSHYSMTLVSLTTFGLVKPSCKSLAVLE
jgi:hypothetical protein